MSTRSERVKIGYLCSKGHFDFDDDPLYDGTCSSHNMGDIYVEISPDWSLTRSQQALSEARAALRWMFERADSQGGAKYAQVEILRELAKDARIRGDVGKEGGVEAWDYLNLYANKIERGDP